MTMITLKHPSIPRHWYINGVTVSGADTAKKAEKIFLAAKNSSEEFHPTADHVRLEAQHRMMTLYGARDVTHLNILLSNDQREVIRLLRKERESWISEEVVRFDELEALDMAIEEIRIASNALEEVSPVPQDYKSDNYWP